MKCSICNKEAELIVPYINAETNETQNICMNCMSKHSIKQTKSVEEIDKIIKEHEKLISDLEELIKKMPKKMEIPKGLEAYAFTPRKLYSSLQKTLAELKIQRLEKLTEAGSKVTLEYELKIAIENEEYEKASKIKKKLELLKQ